MRMRDYIPNLEYSPQYIQYNMCIYNQQVIIKQVIIIVGL